MALITVRARVASTHPMEKYGGIQVAPQALEAMAVAMNAGNVPLTFNHSGSEVIETSNVDVAVVLLDDGEYALEGTFDVEEAAWHAWEAQLEEVGVRGGMSFSAFENQLAPSSGEPPAFSLSADAAGFTDEDRRRAQELFETSAPTEVKRLYEFSAQEVFRVFLEIWEITGPFIVNIASSGIYDGLKFLLARHQSETEIVITDHSPDGSERRTVIKTNDPETLRTVLETLWSSPRTGETSALRVETAPPPLKLSDSPPEDDES